MYTQICKSNCNVQLALVGYILDPPLCSSSHAVISYTCLSYFREILLVRNLILDWFSYGFFIWNFGCMGLMVIHWKGPLRLQQAYLILTSALVVSFTVPPPHLALTTLTIYIANKRVCSLMYVCMYKE